MAEKCYFAHGETELRTPQYNPESQNSNYPQTQQSFQKPYSNIKTVKCIFFERGICKNGTSCSYAHGDQELRIIKNKSNNNLNTQGPPIMIAPKMPEIPIEDNQIIIQQLNYITNELKSLFPNNERVNIILKTVNEFISDYKVDSASDCLHGLLNDLELKEKHGNEFREIVIRAREFGQSIVRQDGGQAQQFGGYEAGVEYGRGVPYNPVHYNGGNYGGYGN